MPFAGCWHGFIADPDPVRRTHQDARFGSIGQAVLPLLLRHIDIRADQMETLNPPA